MPRRHPRRRLTSPRLRAVLSCSMVVVLALAAGGRRAAAQAADVDRTVVRTPTMRRGATRR